MPVAVTGGAFALRIALDARHHGLRQLPPMPIVIAVGLYLAWAALATTTSIDRRVSATYLVGMIAVCALAFWIIPAGLAHRQDRQRLLAPLGVPGGVVAPSLYFSLGAGGVTGVGR